MTTFIDTHAHIDDEQFDFDGQEIWDAARHNGVTHIIIPSINSETIKKLDSKLSKFKDQSFSRMLGLHPCYVEKETFEQEMRFIEQELKNNSPNYVAIGEIGLDLVKAKETIEIQKKCFRTQMKWSKQYGLPVSIHVRGAIELLIQELNDLNFDRFDGVIHCFSGDLKQANFLINMGFHLGIGGLVTFKNSTLSLFLNQIPIDKIVLETDCPYLAPTPYRGKRNQPAYIKLIAQKISELYDLPIAKIGSITTENAKSIFKF